MKKNVWVKIPRVSFRGLKFSLLIHNFLWRNVLILPPRAKTALMCRTKLFSPLARDVALFTSHDLVTLVEWNESPFLKKNFIHNAIFRSIQMIWFILSTEYNCSARTILVRPFIYTDPYSQLTSRNDRKYKVYFLKCNIATAEEKKLSKHYSPNQSGKVTFTFHSKT